MTLTIEISEKMEAALKARAQQQGLSTDLFAARLLEDALTPAGKNGPSSEAQLDLPVFHMGVMGSLRRRDIYEDER